jgi:hypothetical protein
MDTDTVFLFTPFRLDVRNEQLWHGAQAMVLRPKTFAVLRHLVTHAGQLVTQDELLNAVWGPTAISETVVRSSIRELWTTLGDTAQRPQFIQIVLHDRQRQPLVLAVENLPWVDSTSEEWLTALVEHLAGAAILLLVTHRPGYRPPWLAQSVATQMALPRLFPEDSRAVVQSVLQTTLLPEPLLQTIVTKAAGNPFFLEELTWAVMEQRPLSAVPGIPDTIQAVLAARIDRLPPEEKRLLQTAAVIGTEVAIPLLQAIAELPGEAQMLAGRLEDAHALAEQTLALARAHQERGNEAYALRLLGEIATQCDSPALAPAEACYQQALTLAGKLGMRPLVAHCHRGLGILYARIGWPEQAQAALSTAIALYRTMGMTFWLPQAEMALAQVG